MTQILETTVENIAQLKKKMTTSMKEIKLVLVEKGGIIEPMNTLIIEKVETSGKETNLIIKRGQGTPGKIKSAGIKNAIDMNLIEAIHFSNGTTAKAVFSM